MGFQSSFFYYETNEEFEIKDCVFYVIYLLFVSFGGLIFSF